MFEEEQLVLDYLKARRGRDIPFWDVIVAIAKQTQGPDSTLADHKKTIMGLCRRLIREKKVKRKRSRQMNSLRINEAYV